MARKYVIVAASLAGATATITLRDVGADGPVTLIGAEPEPPYERPLLSKSYLRGETAFDKTLVRPAEFYVDTGSRPSSARAPCVTATLDQGIRADWLRELRKTV